MKKLLLLTVILSNGCAFINGTVPPVDKRYFNDGIPREVQYEINGISGNATIMDKAPVKLKDKQRELDVAATLRSHLQKIVDGGTNNGRMKAIERILKRERIPYQLEGIDSISQSNIIVDIRGKSNKTVYLTAHYDKFDSTALGMLSQTTGGATDFLFDWTYTSDGAKDNGVSCSVLLILARWLKTQDLQKSYRIVFFGAEEVGLRGSKIHVNKLPSEQYNKIDYVLNMDGAGAGEFVSVIIEDYFAEAIALQLFNTRAVSGIFPRRGSMVPVLTNSDHSSFSGKLPGEDILSGVLFHGVGSIIPKREWTTVYRKWKPNLMLSSINKGNSFAGTMASIIFGMALLPFGEMHGFRDSASDCKPRNMWKCCWYAKHFIAKMDKVDMAVLLNARDNMTKEKLEKMRSLYLKHAGSGFYKD